jgi:hypothetical protein
MDAVECPSSAPVWSVLRSREGERRRRPPLAQRRGVPALKPALRANRALRSPSTGIVDSHALMLALKATRRRMER